MVALAAAACATDSDPACVNRATQGIVNGTGAPSVVTLAPAQQRAIAFLASPSGACTAVIVRDDWAVTAGHCANLPDNLTLWVDDAPVAVVDLRLHDRLDVAFVRLATPVDGVEPLPLAATRPAVGDEVELAGYGQTEDGCVGSLRYAAESVVDATADEITVDGRGDTGACRGDSGGPLLVPGPAVAGILSRGDPSCLGRDVYLTAPAFADTLPP